AILQQLHEDGRRSSYAMAQKVHLSANAVRYRIKKMVQADIIRFFTATVNLNALGYHLYTVGFILKSLSSSQEAKLKEFLNQERFIIRAVKVLGSWDVLITILADDLKHFHETVKKIVDTFSDIIISYEALIAYEERVYKYIPSVVLQ
ncbi:MAG TPA: Lrp/AsnC family transcriptional regulator, partial [Candidatus Nanoarchaeia archaeon]|nr:Lrp/AsnC family transcriptional regulator [Candidatus Nanoarchaeia archaeon]